MGYGICSVLFWSHGRRYYDRCGCFSVFSKRCAGRVYSGGLPQQCGAAWDCLYTEYLRIGKYCSADDHRQCSAVQYYGGAGTDTFKPGQRGMDKKVIVKTIKGIAANPIIIGIVVGLIWSLLRMPLPQIAAKTVDSIGATATPMGLIAMGASFDFKKAIGHVRPTVTAAMIKLIGLCAVFLPAAAAFGFRDEKIVAILIMLGSATTVSSYVMQKIWDMRGLCLQVL